MRIEPHLGEDEAAYRRQYGPADRSLISYAAIAWVVFTLFFIRSDALFFGQSRLFYTLVCFRVGYSLITIAMLFGLRRFPQARFYDYVVFAWSLLTVINMAWIEFVRPPSYIGHYTLDVLVIMVLYLVPNRFLFRTISAGLFSIVLLLGLLGYKIGLQPMEIDAIIVSCIIANLIGLIMSTRLYTYRRQQFKAVLAAQRSAAALEVLAMTDALTGVYNRRKFFEIGTQEFANFTRYQHPFAVQVIDIDLFKQINDRFGHDGGDQVLKQFVQLVLAHKRATDSFGRLGGEEFGLILPNTTVEAALSQAERIRQLVHDMQIQLSALPISVTVSIGVTEVRPADGSFDAALTRADQLLYRAKQRGRNRVEAEVLEAAPNERPTLRSAH